MLQTRIKNRLIRRGIVVLALLATLPGAPVAAGQTFDEAVAAYGRGDYATAVRGFLVHAEQGYASAQFNLGLMYVNGRGVLKDDAEAVRWYRLAADQGDADAQNNLGLMYGKGEGVLKDDAMYVNGRGVLKDEAARWYRLAAEQGHAEAQFNLGVMHDNGEGVLKDDAEAVRWYRLARAHVRHRARRSQGRRQRCAGTGWLPIRAMPKPSSTSGSCTPRARAFSRTTPNLGLMYAKGEGVLKDDAEAVRWWLPSRASPAPSSTSVSCTPRARAFSRTTPKRCAGSGWLPSRVDADAQFNLGLMYAAGEGILKDEAEAVRWFRLAAEQGVASAQFNLGLMYAKGEGVLKDSVLAHMWFNIAGANGYARARKLRDSLERDMTRAEVSRATELARVCMTSDYQDCEP